MAIPQLHSTPIPPPDTDWSGNLRDVIDVQQQTVKFLLGQWQALLAQIGIGGGAFGPATQFALNALIPSGWWQTIIPDTAGVTIGTVSIGGANINIMSGQFWSDGNVKVSYGGGITLARVAVMEPATP
jgi:hypothetical protein